MPRAALRRNDEYRHFAFASAGHRADLLCLMIDHLSTPMLRFYPTPERHFTL